MSSNTQDRSRRIIRRSIPRLLPKDTDKKADGTAGSQEADPDKGPGAKTNKNKLEKKLSNYRERVDEHPKTRPPLSLQGPFNPDIVGHKKHVDEPKRKRNPTPTRASEKALPNLFPSVKTETDDPKPKRNASQPQQKQKCVVEFSQKAETKFTENLDKAVSFTASGSTAVTAKRPPRSRNASAGNPPSSTISRLHETRRTDKILRDKVQQLEEEQRHLIERHTSEVAELKSKLGSAKDETGKLTKEKSDLEKTLAEQEVKSAAYAEETTKFLEIRSETTEKRLELCQKKLEELNVDPVSLKVVEGGDAEVVRQAHEKATEEAEKLRQSLKTMNQRNQEIIEKLQETKENCPTPD